MDCLKPGDVVILATPPAFRWVHFTYAIEKGLNVFMEKPVTVDGPTTRKMLALGEESAKKNLKVGVGLMCRHCEARERAVQAHQGRPDRRHHHAAGLPHDRPGRLGVHRARSPTSISELLYQIQQFHSFLWASGGCFSDFLIHNIDECCWMKDAWPVQAQASGGRHYRGDYIDQNFDTYSVEYTFADGTKLFLEGRNMAGLPQRVRQLRPRHQGLGDHLHRRRTRRPSAGSTRGRSSRSKDLVWAFPQPEPNPYQLEWDHLIDAIRKDKPLQRGQARRRGQPRDLDGPHGRPHRPGHHLRRDAQLPRTSSRPTSTS